ncbi:MAG: hypothetical protein H0V24_14515 [Chloroflexia bacterium]|nr:hypothetical protein [Chloroflexia bacterium]MDQ3413186.1 hypothetical protein [Chloroflexota bacterium]
MSTHMRYYIVKAEDQPVVRGVPVTRQPAISAASHGESPHQPVAESRKPSVGSVLRLALRRKRDTAEPV